MSNEKQNSSNIIDKASEKISEQFTPDQTNPYIEAGRQEAIQQNQQRDIETIAAAEKTSERNKLKAQAVNDLGTNPSASAVHDARKSADQVADAKENINNRLSDNTKDQEAKENYQSAFLRSLELRTDFAKKPEYVRTKGAEELAYHAVKKQFGEFRPNDREAMENNTNNGKGANVKLPTGETVNVANQALLFDKVVQFNKANGTFYDEKKIEKTSPEDYQRLQKTNDDVATTRKTLIENSPTRAAGYKEVRTAEDFVKKVYEEMKVLKNENIIELKKPLTQAEAETAKVSESKTTDKESASNDFIAKNLGVSTKELTWMKARVAIITAQKAVNKEQEQQSKSTPDIKPNINNDTVNKANNPENSKTENSSSSAKPVPELEKSIEAEKVGTKPIKPIPNELNNQYVIEGDENKGKYFFKDKPDLEAFRDKGSKLITKSTATTVAKSMVSLAESKQWETIKLSGSEKFRREVWMEAKLRGMEVEGYKPSKQDLQNLDDKQNKIENANPNSSKSTLATSSTQKKSPSASVDNKTPLPEVKNNTTSKNSAVEESIPDRRNHVWKNETFVDPDSKKPTQSKADKKVEEIKERLDQAEKDKKNISQFAPKNTQTTKDSLPIVDGQIAKERVLKDEERKNDLRQAYINLPKQEAIQKHPGLEPLYNLEKAAKQFTQHDNNKGKFDSKGQERFIGAVREKALDSLSKGENLPTVSERAPQARQSEKETEVSR